MSDYDMSIHTNPDAKAWAEFFCSTFPSCGISEDVMIGWFANAMMAMHDHIHNIKVHNGDHLQHLIAASNAKII